MKSEFVPNQGEITDFDEAYAIAIKIEKEKKAMQNKTNYFAIKYAPSKWDKYAEVILPPDLWETHFNDNVPISDDFYAPQKANDELEQNLDKYENKARDGSDLSAEDDEEADGYEEDKDDEKIVKIKNRRKNKKKKQIILEPHPFYQSQYGYTGFEGAYTSPLEYYSGGISEEPGAITNNPYNNTYQLANDRSARIKIRAMIFGDLARYT